MTKAATVRSCQNMQRIPLMTGSKFMALRMDDGSHTSQAQLQVWNSMLLHSLLTSSPRTVHFSVDGKFHVLGLAEAESFTVFGKCSYPA